MTQFIRRLVSQNKQRHVTRGAQGEVLFDLDLTYLTENIICMGLPATGPESLYRNPIESIARFLEQQHSGRDKIFNLCNERQYDISHFDGACATFPFDDHGAPPLTLIVAFLEKLLLFPPNIRLPAGFVLFLCPLRLLLLFQSFLSGRCRQSRGCLRWNGKAIERGQLSSHKTSLRARHLRPRHALVGPHLLTREQNYL